MTAFEIEDEIEDETEDEIEDEIGIEAIVILTNGEITHESAFWCGRIFLVIFELYTEIYPASR